MTWPDFNSNVYAIYESLTESHMERRRRIKNALNKFGYAFLKDVPKNRRSECLAFLKKEIADAPQTYTR